MEGEERKHLVNLKQGNLKSFEWLYRHYYQRAYHFCLSFTKSTLDTEEIVSDVFVKIWEKRKGIDPDLPLNGLVLKITKDLTWNYLKKTSRKKELMEAFLQNYTQLTTYDSESEVIFREYQGIIDRAIDNLTPQQQKIFRLRYFKGKDLNQIANELEISKNTVKVHLANSKRFILDQLRVYAG